jgi:hypothetical protein
MICEIYLQQFVFHLVAAVSALAQKREKRQLYTKGERIHKTIPKYRVHQFENKYTKQENKHKKMKKNISRVIRK